MKKRQNAESQRKRLDAQVEEFETKDLGKDLRASGALTVLRRKKSMPTSIALDPALVEKLRAKASRRGIGHRTMLKIIVAEHVDDY